MIPSTSLTTYVPPLDQFKSEQDEKERKIEHEHQPLVVALTKEQTQEIELYCGQSLKNKIDRTVMFVRHAVPKHVKKKFAEESSNLFDCVAPQVIKNSITFCVAGAAVGTLIKPGKGTIKMGIKGLLFGLGLGTLRGSYDYFSKHKVEFVPSKIYEEWRAQANANKVFPHFKKILKASKVFEDFICAISDDITIIPVKAPCGHIFERECIVEWLNNKLQDALCCPYKCARVFTVEDLEYSQERVNKIIIVAMDQIKIHCTKGDDEYSKLLVEGFTAIAKNQHRNSSESYVGAMTIINRRAIELRLPSEDLAKLTKETYDFYMSAANFVIM
jgi:hypothetical protein